jgi:hypothetical protein
MRLPPNGRAVETLIVVQPSFRLSRKGKDDDREKPRQRFIAASLTLAASCAHADAAADIACFTSDTRTPIHFEMRTYYDRDIKFSFASIRYAAAKTAIPVVLQSDAAQDQGSGQPDEVATTWLEVVGGAVSGSYKMVHQGANAGFVTYTNFKTRRYKD